jgi:tetratricopeptide (TPR) repeat protein
LISETELELQFEEATSLRKAGDFRGAKRILERLARERPDAFPVFLILGDVETDLENYEAAEKAFATAIALKPRSELASTAMFFALGRLGRDDDAFAEMHRFLALRPNSKQYKAILDELEESAH